MICSGSQTISYGLRKFIFEKSKERDCCEVIRIAYVINYIVKNGPSSVVLNLINNLNREQYDVSLITLFSGNDPEVVAKLKENGISVYECTTLSRMKCLLGQSKEFDDTVRSGRFDILHTHGLIPDIVSSKLNVPTKKISTLHNNMYEDYLDSYGWVKSRIFIALHLNALKKLNKCVCCSESVYRVMREKLNNTTFIRNGIAPVHARLSVTREGLDIPNEARVFLYAGVLNTRKNIVWLIEKFVQWHNENEYLLVLGEGDKAANCKMKADDHVRMLGFQLDPIAYMNISDVYISASNSEGFSISVLEALSCGLGLFLSDIPSHREVVKMGRDVYLGETFDTVSFEAKLNLLRKEKLDKEKIVAFQRKNLSASGMAEAYQREYKR